MTEADDDQERFLIEGKIAALLPKGEVAINRGAEHGVEVGMRFAILALDAIPINDPDSGEQLDAIDAVKAVVKVVRFQGERVSIARAFRTIAGTPAVDLMNAQLLLGAFRGTPSRPEVLNIDPSEVATPQGDMKIRMGDPVIEAVGDAYGRD